MSSRTRLIEIVGVAGAGKSTLTHSLERRYGWQIADFLHTRARAHWPYVAHSLPSVLGIVARSTTNRPALSWDEVKLAVYVSEWNRFLRSNHHQPGVLVLDQGPIFALACLLWGQKPVTRTAAFARWLGEMVDRWSVELDALVLLEAPDRVLLDRIDNREQRHDAKGRAERDALDLLDGHRAAYARLLGLVAHRGRPPVLRFDTSVRSATEVADEIAPLFGGEPDGWLTDAQRRLNVG